MKYSISMKRWIFGTTLSLSLLFGLSAPVEAAIPAVYTNSNLFTSEQDAPISFIQDTLGNFSGLTATGKAFTQRAVVADIHVRLHSFAIDQANFYISNFGTFLAESDTVALSIYLAQAGWEEVF